MFRLFVCKMKPIWWRDIILIVAKLYRLKHETCDGESNIKLSTVRHCPPIRWLCGIKYKAAMSLTCNLQCKAKAALFLDSVLLSYLRTLPNLSNHVKRCLKKYKVKIQMQMLPQWWVDQGGKWWCKDGYKWRRHWNGNAIRTALRRRGKKENLLYLESFWDDHAALFE